MNCEQRVTIDYIPGTAATIGVTADGITDTLDLKDAVLGVESKTHLKLNPITGNLDFWNENYVRDEDIAYLESISVPEMLQYASVEDLGNIDDEKPKAGDIMYYLADSTCGPDCIGINDKWVKLHAPTANGTYKLTMTVSNGVPTLSWESAS